MKVIRKICISLAVILLICIFIFSGIYAPEKIFKLKDESEKNKIYFEELKSVDLTIRKKNNLYERMRILTEDDLYSVTEFNGTPELNENTVISAVHSFLGRMYLYMNTDMPDIKSAEYSIIPLLFTEKDIMKSVVIWEYSVYLHDQGISMGIMIDDITAKVIGVNIQKMPDNETIDSVQFAVAIQNSLDLTFGAESFSWIEKYENSFLSYIGYHEYTLSVSDDAVIYQFTMCADNTTICFNRAECLNMRQKYGLVRHDDAEFYGDADMIQN